MHHISNNPEAPPSPLNQPAWQAQSIPLLLPTTPEDRHNLIMTRRNPRPRAYAPDPAAPGRTCEMPSCCGMGEYRAPKSRTTLQDYWWFCLEHVRAYNAANTGTAYNAVGSSADAVTPTRPPAIEAPQPGANLDRTARSISGSLLSSMTVSVANQRPKIDCISALSPCPFGVVQRR